MTAASPPIHPVDQKLPPGKLTALGLQHVLVMYAGAGRGAADRRAGRSSSAPSEVALLISADLFCCGIATLIQSLGATQWFGIKLPVMMGVTFASVAPMVADRQRQPGAGRRAVAIRLDHRGRRHLDPHRADGEPACCASFRRWSPAPSSPSSASA